MKGLDNEVEILYYPAGSILVKAGEMNTGKLFSTLTCFCIADLAYCIGLFYVIEGFLEILLPEETKDNGVDNGKSPGFVNNDFRHTRDEKPRSKLLFTVKPGGIAGYLGN
jgi:lysophospholipid hydrolase